MIKVRSLDKRFGTKKVLKGLDYDVEPGSFIVMMGPNGSGKTTFLRILASLARPSAGEVTVAGFSLSEQEQQARRHLGIVLHQPMLYGELSAEENLKFYGSLYRLDNLEQRVGETLEKVGLYLRRRDLVRTFSRGMQQRLAIGRAVLHAPSILLLDEPYTGLDKEACDKLNDILTMMTANNKTVVMATHDMNFRPGMVSRFDVLYRGKISASRSDCGERDQIITWYQKVIE